MDVGAKDDAAGFVLYFSVSRGASCVGHPSSYPVLQLDFEKLVGVAWGPSGVATRHVWQGRLPLVVDQIWRWLALCQRGEKPGGLSQGGMEFSTISSTGASKPQSPFQSAMVLPVLKCSARWSTLIDQLSMTMPQKPHRDRIWGVFTRHLSIDQERNLTLCTNFRCCRR